jgi:hypothetical protein
LLLTATTIIPSSSRTGLSLRNIARDTDSIPVVGFIKQVSIWCMPFKQPFRRCLTHE